MVLSATALGFRAHQHLTAPCTDHVQNICAMTVIDTRTQSPQIDLALTAVRIRSANESAASYQTARALRTVSEILAVQVMGLARLSIFESNRTEI